MGDSSDSDFESMCKTLESSDSDVEEPLKYRKDIPPIEIKR